jgi:hypothetical protein
MDKLFGVGDATALGVAVGLATLATFVLALRTRRATRRLGAGSDLPPLLDRSARLFGDAIASGGQVQARAMMTDEHDELTESLKRQRREAVDRRLRRTLDGVLEGLAEVFAAGRSVEQNDRPDDTHRKIAALQVRAARQGDEAVRSARERLSVLSRRAR